MVGDGLEAAIYIHFPYCLRKCPYCDFASRPVQGESIPHEAYAQALVNEARHKAKQLEAPLPIGSIYLGGGTPSLWKSESLGWALGQLAKAFGLDLGELEVSMECNPSSLDRDKAHRYREAGVNRLSIGVQSLSDKRLKFLGRLHDGRQGRAAIEAALGAGFERVSADLIYGLPDEAPQEAALEAVTLLGDGIEHLSAYMLTIESGTVFGRAHRRGRLPLLEEQLMAESYGAVSDAIVGRGLEHYEVSNFALSGRGCQHNLAVWRGGAYVGLGAGAVGAVPNGTAGWMRTRNVSNPERYLRLWGGQAPGPLAAQEAVVEQEVLDGATRMTERLMLGLRTAEGVDIEQAGQNLGVEGWTERRRRSAKALCAQGRLQMQGNRLRIDRRQWLWVNDTITRLL